MRDRETIEIAIEASETGHLVMSTLHTIDAAKTVERIVGTFRSATSRRSGRASRRRSSTSSRSAAAARRRLRPHRRARDPQVDAAHPRIHREGETSGKTLLDAMKDGKQDGMQHFDGELDKLIRSGTVSLDVGMSYATNPNNLRLEIADFIEDQRQAKLKKEKAS
jgi:twitching motility protein PilT